MPMVTSKSPLSLWNSSDLQTFMVVMGFVGNFVMTYAFKFTSATVSSNLMLMIVPMMYLSGILFFGETLDLLGVLGVFITLSSLVIISKFQ